MMNVTDYTNIKTLLIKFKEKSDVLYAKAAALSNYATIEWVGTQIPSVGDGTVIIKQNGTSKGSFTMNQSGGATINLTDTTYSSLSAVSGGTDKSLVTTGEKYTWNSKQAAISDLATIRSNATTAFGWGDHSKAGYITGITKAMVEGVLTGNITSHTHTFASLALKPTTLKGYGIEDWVLKYAVDSPDTFKTAGIYRVSTDGVTGEGYDFIYGQVLVLRGSTGSDTIAQIAVPYFGSNLYFRSGTISNFTDADHPWRTIFNSGNCNLPTIPWECSSLTANGHVIAKNVLYGQRLEFSNIGSSAGHGGYIDFHYNGNTADYTSRIIEDASGQLTLSAGIVNIGTAAKGFLYLQRPSSNYIWANKAGGEICIGTADGGETSALNSGITIIGKRVYIGGTNSGSNALNVKGAIHATTGIYTDGYISAKQASASSDRRLKKDFRKIDNALKYVLNTHYTRFRWKDDDKESIGIIAQEEQNREYGFLVQNRKEIGHLTYDYAASTALLGAAIQEEDSKVEKLKKRVAELEKELSNLKRKWQH